MVEIIQYPARDSWKALLQRPTLSFDDIESKVLPIIDAVRKEGDQALFRFTQTFDGVVLNQLKVSEIEIKEAITKVDESLKQAIRTAKANIEKFHAIQKETITKVETMPGVTCWRQSVAISKVGLYVPGGTAPLFSTVLMLAVPAVIAGCEEIVLCTPPDKEGNIHPAILFTASLLGITNIFKVGGAQAIAAMALGTESIPAVYKILGPGNQFVTTCKQLITKLGVAIDMPAGPSEVLVIADQSAEPSFVAADLLSQAEHGKDSQVILISDSKEVLNNVNKELAFQTNLLPRKEFALQVLKNSKFILANSITEALEISNVYAPEHLILSLDKAIEYTNLVQNAGSVFLGHYTPESAGDYASGTNHTLPTNGYAKAYSGVSLDTFYKKITFQQITPQGLQNIGSTVEIMAHNEQLFAHANAVTLRLNKIKKL